MTTVKLHTSMGTIKIKLEDQATPETTRNFLNYVNSGFYNGTIFHRVIKGFMIQGGGHEKGMKQKNSENAPIHNEAKTGLKNEIGTIAMARTDAPHSASSQFFINVADNKFLNFQSETQQGYGYCAFGRVTEGMDVVMKISEVQTGRHGYHGDVPTEEVLLLNAEVVPESQTGNAAQT